MKIIDLSQQSEFCRNMPDVKFSEMSKDVLMIALSIKHLAESKGIPIQDLLKELSKEADEVIADFDKRSLRRTFASIFGLYPFQLAYWEDTVVENLLSENARKPSPLADFFDDHSDEEIVEIATHFAVISED